jgi:hypothetical protein
VTDLNSHWRNLYDNHFLGSWNLWDKTKSRYVEVRAKITRITDDEVVGEGGRRSKPLQAHLVGAKGPVKVPFILSKKSCTTLQLMTGSPMPKDWVGLEITIYVRRDTRVRAGTGDVLTIRNTKAGADLKGELQQRQEPAIEPEDMIEPAEMREPGVD